MCVCVCVYIYIYTGKCKCNKEDKPMRGKSVELSSTIC